MCLPARSSCWLSQPTGYRPSPPSALKVHALLHRCHTQSHLLHACTCPCRGRRQTASLGQSLFFPVDTSHRHLWARSQACGIIHTRDKNLQARIRLHRTKDTSCWICRPGSRSVARPTHLVYVRPNQSVHQQVSCQAWVLVNHLTAGPEDEVGVQAQIPGGQQCQAAGLEGCLLLTTNRVQGLARWSLVSRAESMVWQTAPRKHVAG